MAGRLFLVATPIGNLGDLSPRAVETLKAVALVVCEDTRHSRILFEKFGIATSTASLPAFDEAARVDGFVAKLAQGLDLALVTDAGSPGISDPGERLVAAAVAAQIDVVPIPGPAALIAALSASGLPTGRFHFLGFLPRQTSDAAQMLDEVAPLSATLVLYESPKRLVDTLRLLHDRLGNRQACVSRELTKMHEEFVRGSLEELRARFEAETALGELAVVVEGRRQEGRWSEAEIERALAVGLGRGERLKPLASELAKASGWSSQDVYRLGVGLRKP
jgi:16S rRNA (cytidine1402-2'-O)-methyltransferase